MADFGISVDELKKLNEKRGHEALDELRAQYGDVMELCQRLNTSPTNGLSSNGHDLQRRRQIFGTNTIPMKRPTSFLKLIWEAMEDICLIVLIIAAVVSLGLSFYPKGTKLQQDDKFTERSDETTAEWIEGAAIFTAVVIIVLVTAGNNYSKEKQFRGLQSTIQKEQKFSVIRDGQATQVLVNDLVVGDLCQLKYGDQIPADGLLIQGNDLKVDESSLTGESDLIKKAMDRDVQLLSGTHVMEGTGKMMVTAVGINSQIGVIVRLLGIKEVKKKNECAEGSNDGCAADPNTPCTSRGTPPKCKDDDDDEDDDDDCEKKPKTVLQAKLITLVKLVGYAGTAVAVLTTVILIIQYCVEEFVAKGRTYFDPGQVIQYFIKAIIVGVTVLVISMLEGLPIAVTIPLAYSIKKMMKDNNLVRHLYSCETMGNATTICSDKTGTLTTNVMTVVQSYIAGTHFNETPKWDQLPPNLREILVEAISINSSYSSQVSPPSKPGERPKYLGNRTECALLGLVTHLGQSYQRIRDEVPEESFVKVFTFNSARKSMSTVIRKTDSQGGYRVYSKGASEVIIRRCSWYLNKDDEPESLTQDQITRIIRNIVDVMNTNGLRTICLAYKDYVPRHQAPNQFYLDQEVDWDDESSVESGMTLIGIVGIQDPVRPEVPEAIRKCHRAGITVRMVTGDSTNTARSIAIQCGIVKPGDDFLIMDGSDFNRRIRDANGKVQQELLDQIWPRLRVLARSSPTDKYTLVKGIIESNMSKNREVVAVTGDGTNDGPALKEADVGFAMGITGTDLAKEASDIILMDDSFSSIVKAVMWGRNVYDSIAKFLQFQLTVNVVVVIGAFIGACSIGDSPFRPIQMLWVNLIMDTLAALALATESPVPEELLNRAPYGRTKPILSLTMVKNILGQGVYQLFVVYILLYYGDNVFGIDDALTGELDLIPTQHLTIVFNAYVLMTLFNMINARKLHNERNVFSRIFSNPMFCGIWIGCFVAQVLIVEFGGLVFQTSKLTASQWMWCLFLGISVLLWGQVLAAIKLPSKKPSTQTVQKEAFEVHEMAIFDPNDPDFLPTSHEDRTGKRTLEGSSGEQSKNV